MAITLARTQRANHGSRFRAYRLHAGDPALIDPFLGVDHAWMSAPTFPPHPHAGFSAVTYLFLDSETGIANRDSLGNGAVIEPGGLHWTAAGRGVIHEENPAVAGHTTHLLQIFINLPRDRQDAAPSALTLAPRDVPVLRRPGARIRVPLGSFGGARSPLQPPTDVTLLDVSLDAGADLELPLAPGQMAVAMPIVSTAELDGVAFGVDDLAVPILPAAPRAAAHTIAATRRGQDRGAHRRAAATTGAFQWPHGIRDPGGLGRRDRSLPSRRPGKPVTKTTRT